jgi:membrane-associated phospholipid phosphatase
MFTGIIEDIGSVVSLAPLRAGIALTVLLLSWKFERKLFRVFLPVVAALVFSTVYLRYHYVVDVVAGVVLTRFGCLCSVS